MWRAETERAAAGLVSLLASLILIYLGPQLEERGPLWQAAALLVATVSFYAIFEILLRVMTRWRLREVLGRWYYVTWPEYGRKELRYGLMDLSLKGLELDYEVTLFDRLDEMTRADAGEGGGTIGKAECMAIRYHANTRKLFIFWGADFNAQREPQRYGRLMLGVQGGKRLDGEWSSTPNKIDMVRGGMVATRAKGAFRPAAKAAAAFKDAHDRAIAAQLRDGVLKQVGDEIVCAIWPLSAPNQQPGPAPALAPPPAAAPPTPTP